MPSLISWESVQLLLPMLLCGLLAVCVQACSGSTSADARPGAQHRHSQPAAAAQQAGDDDDDIQDRSSFSCAMCCAVLCCAVLCCAALCCAALCCITQLACQAVFMLIGVPSSGPSSLLVQHHRCGVTTNLDMHLGSLVSYLASHLIDAKRRSLSFPFS